MVFINLGAKKNVKLKMIGAKKNVIKFIQIIVADTGTLSDELFKVKAPTG